MNHLESITNTGQLRGSHTSALCTCCFGFLWEAYLSSHCLVLGDCIGPFFFFEGFIVFSLLYSEIMLSVSIGTYSPYILWLIDMENVCIAWGLPSQVTFLKVILRMDHVALSISPISLIHKRFYCIFQWIIFCVSTLLSLSENWKYFLKLPF